MTFFYDLNKRLADLASKQDAQHLAEHATPAAQQPKKGSLAQALNERDMGKHNNATTGFAVGHALPPEGGLEVGLGVGLAGRTGGRPPKLDRLRSKYHAQHRRRPSRAVPSWGGVATAPRGKCLCRAVRARRKSARNVSEPCARTIATGPCPLLLAAGLPDGGPTWAMPHLKVGNATSGAQPSLRDGTPKTPPANGRLWSRWPSL